MIFPNQHRARQGGASMVEFVITFAILGPVLLGIFQAVLLYRAKTVLDYASLEAARRGATHSAEMSAMCKGLAAGLMPLYVHQPSAAETLSAYAKADMDVCLAHAAKITIVNPTRAAFSDWQERQFDGVQAIPNDSLAYRGSAVGARSGLTVQDANLLKISVSYNYPLIVPLIDRMIGTLDPARTAEKGHVVYSLRLVSQAIVRMQSPIRNPSILP